MTTLKDIKQHMLNYLSDFKINEDGYYDEDGHCGDGLCNEILDYWQNFETDNDFQYLVSGEWDGDLDLEGGRDYILSHSNVMPLLFDYMTNTLGWNKEKFESILWNTTTFNEELEDMYDGYVKENIDLVNWNESDNHIKYKELLNEIESQNFPDLSYDYIPKYVKYSFNMKDIIEKNYNDTLKYISESRIGDGSIYEIIQLGCRIPKGYIVILTVNEQLKNS